MDRRQFLQLSALFAAPLATSSCSKNTSRYLAPQPLVRTEESLLLRNVRLVDVRSGRLRPEKEIRISGGRIEGIGHTSTQRLSADKTLDLDGAYITPGLMNLHTHMTLPSGLSLRPGMLFSLERQAERNAEECIRHGVTTVRDMLAFSDWLDRLTDKIDRGEIIGPRILSSRALCIEGGYGSKMIPIRKPKFWKMIQSAEEGATAVREAKDNGIHCIKLFQQPKELFIPGKPLEVMDVQTIRSVTEEAGRQGLAVALHQTEHGGFNRGIDGGIRDMQHVIRDYPFTDEDLRRMQDAKAAVIPTLSAPFGLAHKSPGDARWASEDLQNFNTWRKRVFPDLLREYLEPEFVRGSLDYFNRLARPESYTRKHLIPWPDQNVFTSAVVLGKSNAKKLYDAGIPFGCGNDGGIPFVFPGALHIEIEMLEQIGIPAAEGLKMATLNNAKLMGLESTLGSIDEGKLADLAVFRNNPLQSALHLKKPLMVFQEGRLRHVREGFNPRSV